MQFDDIIAELSQDRRWSLSDLYPDEYDDFSDIDDAGYDDFEDYLGQYLEIDTYELADALDIINQHNAELE